MQAIRYTPYSRLYQTAGQDGVAPEGVDLDYTKMLPPIVLLESLKRRHLLVFFATIASLLLKALVVLSSGFFLTASVQRSIPVEVDMLDFFVTNMDSFEADGAAYSVASAVQDFGMQLPLGVDSDGAYQTFKMRSPWKQDNVETFRGTVDALLEVTVDHISVDTECLPLQRYDVSNPDSLPYEADDQFFTDWYKKIQVRLQFEACDDEITVPMGTIIDAQGPFSKNRATHWLVAGGGQGLEDTSQPGDNSGVIKGINITHACPSLSQKGPMILYMMGSWGPSEDDESIPSLEACAATVCFASAGVSKAKVVDDGLRPVVTVQPGEKETIDLDSKIWSALLRYPTTAFFQKIRADPFLEGPVLRVADSGGETLDPDDVPQLTSDDLAQSVYNMTERARPMIGHLKFRQASDVPEVRPGVIHTQLSRLQVSRGVGVSMVVLSTLCLGIALGLVMESRRTLKAWYRDPASILGQMSLFAEPSEIRAAVESVSSTTRAENEGQWQKGGFSPIVLRGWVRALLTGYVIALIATLAVTLRISESSQGLATVGDEGHSPLWKLIPSMALFIVTLYIASADTAIRALSELLILSSKANFFTIQDHDRSLLDMVGLRAWYYSIKLKVPAVTASQSMALVASVLVTLTSSLFDSRSVPQSTTEFLPTESWFGTRELPGPSDPSKGNFDANLHGARDVVSGLLLIQDTDEFTSPQNTFHDLLLPSFDSSIATTSPILSRASSVEIKAPVARLDGQCSRFEEGRDFHVEMGSPDSRLHLDGFNCGGNPIIIHQTSTVENPMNKYIASEVNYKDENECQNLDPETEEWTLWNKPWVATTYAWGEVSRESSKPEILHLSVWRCNYTWVEVTSDLTFISSDGELVLEHASSPDDSDAPRPWEPPFNPPSLKTAFNTLSSGLPRVASSFMLVVGDQGPLEYQDLGDPSRDEDILQRLKSNMAFAAAQLANIESRLGLSEKSFLPPENPGELPPIEAAFIRERQRLLQDSNVTYALVAILSFIAAVNLWALASAVVRRFLSDPEQTAWWLLDLELKGQAPPGFRSISMMEALLHGSNYTSYMPENASRMSPKELYRYLAGTRFRMGWFRDEAGGDGNFTIGVVPDRQDPAGVMLNGESSEK